MATHMAGAQGHLASRGLSLVWCNVLRKQQRIPPPLPRTHGGGGRVCVRARTGDLGPRELDLGPLVRVTSKRKRGDVNSLSGIDSELPAPLSLR